MHAVHPSFAICSDGNGTATLWDSILLLGCDFPTKGPLLAVRMDYGYSRIFLTAGKDSYQPFTYKHGLALNSIQNFHFVYRIAQYMLASDFIDTSATLHVFGLGTSLGRMKCYTMGHSGSYSLLIFSQLLSPRARRKSFKSKLFF